jgi:hypothetical protein
VPQKKKRSRSWLKKLLLLILTPIFIWLAAFIIWFRWDDIRVLFNKPEEPPKASDGRTRQIDDSRGAEARLDKPPRENIFEEDRRKLEEILKSK